MSKKPGKKLSAALNLCTDPFQRSLVLGVETLGCCTLAGKSDSDRQGHINSARALMAVLSAAGIHYYVQPDLMGSLYDSRIYIL
jgi:hypothetical protein